METAKKSSGVTWCSAYNCSNNSKQAEKRSFFRFPKERSQSKKWVIACRRLDLEKKDANYLYNNCKLCSDHFEDIMFLNDLRNRLHLHAVPTIFNIKNPPPRVQSTRRPLRKVFEQPNQHVPKKPKLIEPEGSGICLLQDGTDIETARILLSLSRTGIPPTDVNEEVASVLAVPSSPLPVSSLPQSHCSVIKNTGSKKLSYSPRKSLKKMANKWKCRAYRLSKSVQKQGNKVSECFHCKCCTKNLPPKLQTFLNLFAKENGGQYSDELKSFSLSVYFISPQAYMLLRDYLPLPSKRLLQLLISKVQVSAGLGEWMIDMMKLKVSTLNDLDKNCVLCIDEMSLKPHLAYNTAKDKITGFVDLGKVNTTHLATCALVFLIRGIAGNWKQPISFYFCSESCPAKDLQVLLFEAIRKLKAIGLLVKVVVSDMGSNFLELVHTLGVSQQQPYFECSDMKVHYIFDPPHLIKATRNNLMSKTFHFGDKKASWADIQKLYFIDKALSHRLVPKLFDSHINLSGFSKMRVKYATQVLSHTTAAAINANVAMGELPASAEGTAAFVENFDKLFDCFNSSILKSPNKYKSALSQMSCHKPFLLEMLTFLDELCVRNKVGKDITKSVKCLFGWKVSIHSILSLWELLHNECAFSFLLSRRLNQDALENFFCTVRQQGGNSDHPTPSQFITAFRQLSLQVQGIFSTSANCSFVSGDCMVNVADLSHSVLNAVSNTHIGGSLNVQTQDYRHLNIPAQNGLLYVAGYIYSKCLQKHECDVCKQLGNENSRLLDFSQLFCHFKAYETKNSDFSSLCMPHDQFVTFVSALESTFSSLFKTIQHEDSVGQQILTKCLDIEYQHPCSSFPKLYAVKLYIRMMICHTLKRINKDKAKQACMKRRNKKLNKLTE